MSEEKKSCKEQANEVLLQALKAHAFAFRSERLTKRDAEIMAILAGAITGPLPENAAAWIEEQKASLEKKEAFLEKREALRKEAWEEYWGNERRVTRAQAAKTPEELEAEETLWRERFSDPEEGQISG